MSALVENAASPGLQSQTFAPFQITETRPDGITCHMIFDHELDDLTNVSRPIVLGLATCFLGAVIGLLPSVSDIVDLVAVGKAIGWGNLALTFAFGLSIAGTGAFGFFAIQGQRDALAKKQEIRSRDAVTVLRGALGGNVSPGASSPSA